MNNQTNKLYKDTFKLRFYGENYAFININPEIVKELGLTEGDSIIEELTDDGRIVLKRKEIA